MPWLRSVMQLPLARMTITWSAWPKLLADGKPPRSNVIHAPSAENRGEASKNPVGGEGRAWGVLPSGFVFRMDWRLAGVLGATHGWRVAGTGEDLAAGA